MEGRYTIQRLLAHRKLTRAVADLLRARMVAYVTTLAPIIRPRADLTDYVPGGIKGPVRGAAKTFDELTARYDAIARAKPFNLMADLKAPIGAMGAALEMTPVEYEHVAAAGTESKRVVITQPLTWVLSPAGLGPERLRDMLRTRPPDADQLQRLIVQYVVLDLMLASHPGIGQILAALHFPLRGGKLADLGELPITFITASVPTLRPPDEVIMESTEVSGQDAFQEIVDIDAIVALRDPLREELLGLVKSHGEVAAEGGA